ncbi:MAG TPA: hypothetical protein VI424_12740 [Terriglobales bacterium]
MTLRRMAGMGRRAGWSFIAALCLAIALSAILPAQTVRPLIDENVVKAAGKKASGKIEYYNDSLQPLNVTLEAKSFTVSPTGEISYRPLDGDVHLKLSEMSFRIPPRQSHYVFYQAWSDRLPAWCVLYAAFSGFRERTPEGFMIQVQLPHTIYLLPKQRLQKGNLSIVRAQYLPQAKKVVIRVANSGDTFGRVLEADVQGRKTRATQGGFPLFPNSERQVEIPWQATSVPSKVVLHFDRFTMETEVQGATP